ncbi:MAG: S-methyl-5-thioribose-1-phosphate isomerase [Calditrichaeota bacterium]|nr:S-methyl-5-thioribose-1-phosphate isomerase [Calditrichota bacterium]
MNLETISFKNNTLKILDQTVLPSRQEYLHLATLEQVIEAIKTLKVRGAPAIGVVAAYGLVVEALNLNKNHSLTAEKLKESAKLLKTARPTAVNLAWAADRMIGRIEFLSDAEEILSVLKNEALAIHEEDKQTCDKIGEFGSQLISDGFNILTHCNTGFLATGGIGTALGVVYKAFEQGKKVHVFVDETRPVGQGARLTYWELKQNNVPATLITDNMAGCLMKDKKVDFVITGADRIALNGDTANKIGTYPLAVLAQYHNIPFYVAAPLSTFDPSVKEGDQIPIEQRSKNEVLKFWGIDSLDFYEVFNPAFDVTPGELITGIITEYGILQKPYTDQITRIFKHFNNKGDVL